MVTTLLFSFMPLIAGFDFNAWLKVSSAMINRRADNGHPWRIPHFREKYLDVNPLLILHRKKPNDT